MAKLAIGGNNFILGPAFEFSQSFQSSVATTQWHRLKFACQGNKRLAILGVQWNIENMYNEENLSWQANLEWKYNDCSRRRKDHGNDRQVFAVNPCWIASAVESPQPPTDLNGAFAFPQAFIVKNGTLILRCNVVAGLTNIAIRMRFYLANAIMLNDMGDYYDSTDLNFGRMRSARKGETRVEPYSRGGITHYT